MNADNIRAFNRAYGDELLVAAPSPDLSLRVADALVHGVTPVILKGSPDLLRGILEAPIIDSPQDATAAFHALFPIREPHDYISGLCGALALIPSARTESHFARISWFLGRTCRFGSQIISDSGVESALRTINRSSQCASTLILN